MNERLSVQYKHRHSIRAVLTKIPNYKINIQTSSQNSLRGLDNLIITQNSMYKSFYNYYN